MFYLDLTLPTPAENLALDEALLAEAEANGGPEVLRTWESPAPFVVLGLGGSRADDVHDDACAADGVPVLRRASGGGTVLQGPGCLSYALVLRIDRDPALASITGTNEYVLRRIVAAFAPGTPGLAYRGVSDIALGAKKISGNAQRRKKAWVLFHGTFLHGMDAAALTRYLKEPKRRPEYRAQRTHGEFVTRFARSPAEIKAALRDGWGAQETLQAWPRERMAAMVATVLRREPTVTP